MPTLTGKGVIWGVGTTASSGVVVDSTDLIQGSDFNYDSDIEELRDATGEVKGLAYYNLKKTLTISVVPAEATIANAITGAAAMIVPPGTAVTVADTNVTDVQTSTAYVCDSSSARQTNTGATVIDINLRQHAGITDYSTISS